MSQPDYNNMRKLVTGDIVVKCRYGKDIRRLAINQAPTYDELCLMVSRIFKLPSSEDFTLKYTDNENDLISLLDDNDISHAISLSTLLKITIFDKTCSDADTLVPGTLSDELKSKLTTLRDSLDDILRFVPEKKVDGQTQSGDVKYKPLSTAELDVSTGSRPSLTPKASTDTLPTTTTANTNENGSKQTPTMKNAMYFPPPGTPKQMPMKSPALQQMHPPVPYNQRASPLSYPNYGPPQVSPSAPGTPHSGGGATPYQPNNNNNNVNKLAGPAGYMNARPPPPPNMQQPQRQQNGYPTPGTPLAQHQFPSQQMQHRPPPPQQQQHQPSAQQQQQQRPPNQPPTQAQPATSAQVPPPTSVQAPPAQPGTQAPPAQAPPAQGPPSDQQQSQSQPQTQGPPPPSQNQGPVSSMPPAGFNPPPPTVTAQQGPPQQGPPQQQQNYFYQPPNGQQQQQQQQPPQTPQQNFRPPPNSNIRW